MQTYKYEARDPKTGSTTSAELEADSERAAAHLLQDRGLVVLNISAKSEGKGLLGFTGHVSAKQKVIFSRQISTLINAGLPLVQSLRNVSDHMTDKNLKVITAKVINDVEAGSTFADAIAKYPKVFDSVYVSLVAAGESSGTLDKALERLANQQEKDGEIVAKVRGALLYPLMILLVLAGVVIFMLTTVLPQVQQLYASLPGVKLPFLTVLLLSVSHFLLHFWWLLILFLVASTYGLRTWAKTVIGRSTIDSLKLHMWPTASLFNKLYMARFARTAATLVASGIPIIKMLNTTAQAVDNVHVADSIAKASAQVQGGKSLSEGLKNDPNFLDLVPNMIQIGEQSGQLENMLSKTADYYEKEVDNQIKSISTIIEPALIVVVGIMALIIVAAVLLPIYGLAGKNLGGGH